MGLFSSKHAEAPREIRESGFAGPVDNHGEAVMSRTDSSGRPLDLAERGSLGHGTPDEERASRLPRR